MSGKPHPIRGIGEVPDRDSGRDWLETLRKERDAKERAEVVAAVEAAGVNLAEAARTLNMSRGGVIARLQKHGLLPGRKK